MCIVAAKWFPTVGWVGVKNRDRNYKPTIKIKHSQRTGIERLYIWDIKTKYAEGVNEFGVSIISAATAVKTDEKEGEESSEKKTEFYSPDGKRIRSALLENTVEDALARLIEVEIPGNTLIFDKDKCFLLEGTFEIDEKTGEPGDYIYKTLEIKQNQSIVRTNHGVILPEAGYQLDAEDEHHRAARKSSDARMKRTEEVLKKITGPEKMFDCVSTQDNKNLQFNPLRTSKTHGKTIMVTTGQIMIVASERTLHYRPIWCEIDVKFGSDMESSKKTWFEIVSNKKLISFKEQFRINNSYKP